MKVFARACAALLARRLEPEPTCPVHAVDLTSEVSAELQADPDLVSDAFLRARAVRTGLRPYLVIVMCPQGDGHELEVSGSWEP